jgi:hypothetical protein
MEERGDVVSGNLYKKARLRSKWLVLEVFIERPWSLRVFEIHKSKRCLKYFEAGKQKGEINLRGLNVKEAPALNDSEHKFVFVIYDATGLEVLTLSGSSKENTAEWVAALNTVALGKPFSVKKPPASTDKSAASPTRPPGSVNKSESSHSLLESADRHPEDDENFFRDYSLHSFTSGSESSEELSDAKPKSKRPVSKRHSRPTGSRPERQSHSSSIQATKPEADVAAPAQSIGDVAGAGDSSAPAGYTDAELDVEETALPHGISLRCLLTIRDYIATKELEAQRTLTVFSVCEEFVKPATTDFEVSLATVLSYQNLREIAGRSKFLAELVKPHSQDQLRSDKADIFVSYSWSYSFVDLVDAIESFCMGGGVNNISSGTDYLSTSVWLDCLCENQFKSGLLPSKWFEMTYPALIQSIGHTVCVVLEPASSGTVASSSSSANVAVAAGTQDIPVIFTRTWSLWELLCSISGAGKLSVVHGVPTVLVCDEQGCENSIKHTLDCRVTWFQRFVNSILAISISGSECNNYADRQRILESVAYGYHTKGATSEDAANSSASSVRRMNSLLALNEANFDIRHELLDWFIESFIQTLSGSLREYVRGLDAKLYVYSQLLAFLTEKSGYFMCERFGWAMLKDIKESAGSAVLGSDYAETVFQSERQLADCALFTAGDKASYVAAIQWIADKYSNNSVLGKESLYDLANNAAAVLLANNDVSTLEQVLIPLSNARASADASSGVGRNDVDWSDLDRNHNYPIILFAERFDAQAMYILKQLKRTLSALVASSGSMATSAENSSTFYDSRYVACINNYAVLLMSSGDDVAVGKEELKRVLTWFFRYVEAPELSEPQMAGSDAASEPQMPDHPDFSYLLNKAACVRAVGGIRPADAGAYLSLFNNCFLVFKTDLSAPQQQCMLQCTLLLNVLTQGFNSGATHDAICLFAQTLFLEGNLLEAEKYYRSSLSWRQSSSRPGPEISASAGGAAASSSLAVPQPPRGGVSLAVSTLHCMAGLARVYREIRTTDSLTESQKLYVEIIEKMDAQRQAAHKEALRVNKQALEKLKNSVEYKDKSVFLSKCLFYLSLIKIQRCLYGEAIVLLERCQDLFAVSLGPNSALTLKAVDMLHRTKELSNRND